MATSETKAAEAAVVEVEFIGPGGGEDWHRRELGKVDGLSAEYFWDRTNGHKTPMAQEDARKVKSGPHGAEFKYKGLAD